MGLYSAPKEEIASEIVGWTITAFDYIQEGFSLELERGAEKKRVNIIATGLGIGLDSIIDLKTNILMVSSTYELIYERLFDAAEKGPVTLFRDDEFIGFKSDGLKVLMKKEDLEIYRNLFGTWAPAASVMMWGGQALFQKMIYHWKSGSAWDADAANFLDGKLDPEEFELFVKTEMGEEAWERLKDVQMK